MPYMDFSKNNLTPSGANKYLAVRPGIPEKEGYVTETQFKDWLKTCLIVLGYLDSGEFYEEAGHTTVIPKDENCLYVDMTSPTNFALYVCKSNTYKPLTEESQIAAVVTSLQNGTLVPLKAKQDQNGNVIDTTYFKIADLYNGVDSQATDKAATANVAYELQQEINNLKARGRFLSAWNCVLGLPSTNPIESPYPYKAGDYYIVSTTVESALDNVPNYDPLADYNVGDFCKESGTLYQCKTPITGGEAFDPSHWDAKTDNYKPSGSSYTTGVASTVVESGEVKPNDYYEYDGTSWLFLHNTQKTVTFSQIAGAPTDNAALSLALAAKLDTSKVYDGLDKTVAGFALDAKQGKVLSDAINAISTYTDLNVTLDDSTNFSLSYARARYYPLLKIIFVQIRLGSSDLSSQRYQPITISLPKNLPFAQMLSCTGEEQDGGYFDMTLGCWVAPSTGKVSIDTRGYTFANPRISGILVY